MRDIASTLEKIRFWGPTTVAGTLSTTGVALLLAAVAASPAYSMPAEPPDSTPVTVQSVPDGPTQNCFIGQSRWPADMSPQPQCTVAQRIAGRPGG